MPRPNKLPRWATGGTILEPSEGEKTTGWPSGFRPPAPWWNWRDNLAYQWLLALAILMVGNWFKRVTASTSILHGIFYGADFWIAVGDDTGGVTPFELQYSRQQLDKWVGKTGLPISRDWYSGLYDGTNYIVVGQDTSLMHATDPTGTWTNNSPGGGGVIIYCIDHDGTTYYVIGKSNGDLMYATDPTGAWTNRTLPSAHIVWDVKYAAGYWVAVTENGHIFYRAADPTGVWSENTTHPFGSLDLHAVTHDGTKWIIGAEDATGNILIATSADPTGTFVDKTPSALKAGSVGHRGLDADASGTIVATCENAIIYSTDSGDTWEIVAVEDPASNSYLHVRSNGAGTWGCITDTDGEIRRTLKV